MKSNAYANEGKGLSDFTLPPTTFLIFLLSSSWMDLYWFMLSLERLPLYQGHKGGERKRAPGRRKERKSSCAQRGGSKEDGKVLQEGGWMGLYSHPWPLPLAVLDGGQWGYIEH